MTKLPSNLVLVATMLASTSAFAAAVNITNASFEAQTIADGALSSSAVTG